MKQEDKELLLRDLSARVPYGVMVEQTLFPPSLADKEQRLKSVQANNVVQLYWYKYINEFVPIHCIKPYLRQMSSMTEEERFDYVASTKEERCIPELPIQPRAESTDWLNKHHFDYRGLIDKSLALEAPEDMYNTK